MKLGFFTMPMHPPGRDYTQTLKEDREAVILADKLGYCEAFIGESLNYHHVAGFGEVISFRLAHAVDASARAAEHRLLTFDAAQRHGLSDDALLMISGSTLARRGDLRRLQDQIGLTPKPARRRQDETCGRTEKRAFLIPAELTVFARPRCRR